MNKTLNYAWPVTSVNREDYLAFETWFNEHRELLRQKDVIIWGAGIRGTEFSLFFEKLQFTNVCFTDSNIEKWGGWINEFPIISIDEVDERVKKNAIILVSTENSQEIEKALEAKGYSQEKEYYVIKTDLYKKYVEEYNRDLKDYALIMSDCEFLTISIHDTDWDTMEDMIKKKKMRIPIKCLAMHGLGLRAQYMICREQIIKEQIPKVLGVMVNFDTLTGKQHLLPRSQHSELFEMICKSSKTSEEFKEYFQLTKQRSQNIQVEFLTEGKSERKKDKEDIERKSRNYFMLNYLYRLDMETEGVLYLREIIKLAEKYQIKLFFFIPPVNYLWGRKVVGEIFDTRYQKNVQKIMEVIGDNTVIDFSYMFTSDYFAELTTADETVNEKGRRAMSALICDNIAKMEEYDGRRDIRNFTAN